MWFFTTKTVETIAGIFQADKRKELSGVVGSYEMTRQTIELDAQRALYLLAIISLSLGVINLFPFLPLDGGHIFWALAEKVRGRAIPFSVMERAGFVGFVLVIALFMIGLTNDVGRLVTGSGSEAFGVRVELRGSSAVPTGGGAPRSPRRSGTRSRSTRTASRSARRTTRSRSTWSELRDRVDALAGGLAKLGVRAATPSR